MAATFYGGAHQFNINEAHLTSFHVSEGKALNALHKQSCSRSTHDSSERGDAPRCHPRTRVHIQQNIIAWLVGMVDEDEFFAKHMMWVSGSAGAGKTAIMGSITQTLHKDGLLGASFFFASTSASTCRRSKRFFIPTLAHQLAQHPNLGGLKAPILAAVEKYPELSEKNLATQADILILEPLRQAWGEVDRANWPRAIVVDGLDECQAENDPESVREASERKRMNGNDQLEILRVLAQLVLDPVFPFRILIASRPDPVIYTFFNGEGSQTAAITLLDNRFKPDKDIEVYLHSGFADIRRRYPTLDANWPAPDVVPTLVSNASGQFAYPSAIMKYIDDEENPESPVTLLEVIMRSASTSSSVPSNPLSSLDAMYAAILNSTPDPLLCVTWIQAIRWFDELQKGCSLSAETRTTKRANKFLEINPGEASKILSPLRSLIDIPGPEAQWDGYCFHHKTFLDYLDDPARSGPLYVNNTCQDNPNDRSLRFEHFIFIRCLRFLSRKDIDKAEDAEIDLLKLDRILASIAQRKSAWLVSKETDLLQVDVVRWAEVSIRQDPQTLCSVFMDVHAACKSLRCTPACKYWRSCILQVCKCKGWSVQEDLIRWLRRLVGRPSPPSER